MVQPTTCLLDPCSLWLVKASGGGIQGPLWDIINVSLTFRVYPEGLKEAVVTPLLKKSKLDSLDLTNYRSVSNLSFLGKVFERAAVEQLQACIETAWATRREGRSQSMLHGGSWLHAQRKRMRRRAKWLHILPTQQFLGQHHEHQQP